jgi:hypothetical protein
VNEHGGTNECAGGWRHAATVPSPSPTSRRLLGTDSPNYLPMVVWRWACICIRSMGSLILVLPLPLRWAVKSVALLIRVHPTGVSSSSCMDQAAMLCQVPLVAIARKGSANGDKTPVGERQVAVVAALPMSSRFAGRFAAIER